MIAPLQAKTIVILGDSLSAGFGVTLEHSWVEMLRTKIKKLNSQYLVVNLSTSGDTSRNGLNKLKRAYSKYTVDVLVIQIGSNDALRGIRLKELRKNVINLIKVAKKNNSQVLLVANRIPPNYGKTFTTLYARTFKEIACQFNIPLVPKFLKGVAEKTSLMQSDGLHPNTQAQPILLDNVWQKLGPLLHPKITSASL